MTYHPRIGASSIALALLFAAIAGLVTDAQEPAPGSAGTADEGGPGALIDAAAEARQQLAALLSQARQKQASGDFDAAIAAYGEYLAKAPKPAGPLDLARSRVHYNLAAVHVAREQTGEAFRELERAVELGMWRRDLLERDPALTAIRKAPEFARIIELAASGPARMAFGRRSLDGSEIAAADHEGKVLIIDVWGTWCPPCREEVPLFVELQQKYEKHGLRVIGLTYEKTEPSEALEKQVKRFIELLGVNYACALVDSELIGNVPIEQYPTTYFIDHEGKIAKKFIGKQTLYTLESEAVRLLNRRIIAAKKKEAERRESNRPSSLQNADPATAVPR